MRKPPRAGRANETTPTVSLADKASIHPVSGGASAVSAMTLAARATCDECSVLYALRFAAREGTRRRLLLARALPIELKPSRQLDHRRAQRGSVGLSLQRRACALWGRAARSRSALASYIASPSRPFLRGPQKKNRVPDVGSRDAFLPSAEQPMIFSQLVTAVNWGDDEIRR